MKEWEKSLNMVGDENHFQKGSQLQEEIASGISKGRGENEKWFTPYFRLQSLAPISFPQKPFSWGVGGEENKQNPMNIV